MVQVISDDYSLHDLIKTNRSKLIVIDFYADWCGPCRMIAPIVEQLSQKYKNGTVFLKVNVDLCKQTSALFRVQAMPTFVFLVNGLEVDRLRGANSQLLEEKVVQHLSGALASSSSRMVATEDERRFLEKFTLYSRRMTIYKDEIAKTLALSVIPYDHLREKSLENNVVNEFLLIQNLLRWFKTEFFSWVDVPECENCHVVPPRETGIRGSVLPNEQRFGANDVEIYRCSSCSATIRFPRYNDPTKLLETRRGRCGEWANCFVLCCQALDFDTRWVYDVTDHIWCEVWLESLDRWVHCDPCEGICDTPLLYERGWGKKLSYVIALGNDHIRDVTWRYTFDHKETCSRRMACREAVLRNFMKKLNVRYERYMSDERKKEVERRYLKELVEFLSPNVQVRDGNDLEKQGRITGSEQWKRERGEAGNSTESQASFIFRPSKTELAAKTFSLEYFCAKDEYRRGEKVIHGWRNLLNKEKNVMRKEELDWKMTYLCRKVGTSDGELSWSFDFSGNEVKDLEISIKGMAEFQSGKVLVVACSGDSCMLVPKTGTLKLENLDSGKLDIKVTFSCGEGDLAWQHAQLFRSGMKSEEADLIVNIRLG